MCISRINITFRNIYTCSTYNLLSLHVISHRNQIFRTSAYFSYPVLFFFFPKGSIFTRGRVMGLRSIDTAVACDPLFLWFRFRIVAVDRTFSSVIDRRGDFQQFRWQCAENVVVTNTIWKYGFRMLTREHRLIARVGNITQDGANRSENWTKLLRDINVENYSPYLFNWKFSENALICPNIPKSSQFFASLVSTLILKYCYRFRNNFFHCSWDMNFSRV